MSVRASTFAWQVQGLAPQSKLLLLALADHADDDGRCWPSQPRLATMTGLHPDALRRRWLPELVKLGVVHLESVGRGTGHSTRYRIVLETGTQTPLSDGANGAEPGTPVTRSKRNQTGTRIPRSTGQSGTDVTGCDEKETGMAVTPSPVESGTDITGSREIETGTPVLGNRDARPLKPGRPSAERGTPIPLNRKEPSLTIKEPSEASQLLTKESETFLLRSGRDRKGVPVEEIERRQAEKSADQIRIAEVGATLEPTKRPSIAEQFRAEERARLRKKLGAEPEGNR